ncbi:SDR family NAD(P)-dependent oxidoreductase, partial [Mesoflavibacter zeaxanthinifaciens]
MSNIALITGASSGMGKSTAKILQNQGYKVYGAARRLEQMQDLKDLGIAIISLDLTKDES